MLKSVVYSAHILFVIMFHTQSVSSQLSPDQVTTMIRVYDIIQEDTAASFVWHNVEKNSNPCSWLGVICSTGNSSIKHLSLGKFSISSSDVLPILCYITSLESIDVSNNYLTSVPDEFVTNCGKINGLKLLNFSMNRLSDPLPAFYGFRALEFLDFSRNRLRGEIKLELNELDSLKCLDLSRNLFSGTVPTNLGKMNLLQELWLSNNNFIDEIPVEITKYSNLRVIDLSRNMLAGSIPPELGELPMLEILALSLNSFMGEIPTSLSNITTLKRLDLSYNMLRGTIPAKLLSGPNLQSVDLTRNQLQGQIPASISSKLFRLRLGSNFLSGRIPVWVSVGDLMYLELDNNSLSGVIPFGLGRCWSLALLNIARNNLMGALPPVLGDLTDLQVLSLESNNFTGEIPSRISRLSRLERLNMSRNALNGYIPSSLSGMVSLKVLDLSNNKLSGEIPNSLTQLGELTVLVLSGNQLSGAVPHFCLRVALDTRGNTNLIARRVNLTPPPQRKSEPEPKSDQSDFGIAFASGVPVGLLITLAISLVRKYNRTHCNLLTPSSIYRSNISFKKAMEAVADPSNITLKTRFSTYYKAVMPSGTTYLVKKVKLMSNLSQEKLGEELEEALGKLSNPNIMIPVAYVLRGRSAYLLYDSVPKCTLSYILHHRKGDPLDWASRYAIAVGVCQGLAFLHECNSGPIILVDLSSESILLKSINEPQIGDIELCKLLRPRSRRSWRSNGISAYVPPEYGGERMRGTAKGNVYSFGVVLLELVTGKEVVGGGSELIEWVLMLHQQHKWHHILDASLSKTSAAVTRQMLRVLEAALDCVSVSPEMMPNIPSVLLQMQFNDLPHEH